MEMSVEHERGKCAGCEERMTMGILLVIVGMTNDGDANGDGR